LTETKETATRYFDEVAPVYFDENYTKTNEKYPILYLRQKYILDMIDGSRGKALDVGCGSGAMLVDLTKRGFEAFGVDISANMLKSARELSSKLGLREPPSLVADIENLPFAKGSFDLIICAGVVEYLTRDDRALSEISRVLRSDGTAFITVTNALTPYFFLETVAKISSIWPKMISLANGGVPFPRARVHAPFSLVNMAAKTGLEEVDRAYFDFTPFPFPLGVNFPNLRKSLGLKMEKLSKTRLGFIARGCIIKFAKKN